MKKIFSIVLLSVLLIQCQTTTKNETKKIKRGFMAKKAMVVCARPEAAAIGVAIMKQGGNAFDAMIATHLALAVTYPFAGNIAGGGFMVYRTKDGKAGALDFREEKSYSTCNRFSKKRCCGYKKTSCKYESLS